MQFPLLSRCFQMSFAAYALTSVSNMEMVKSFPSSNDCNILMSIIELFWVLSNFKAERHLWIAGCLSVCLLSFFHFSPFHSLSRFLSPSISLSLSTLTLSLCLSFAISVCLFVVWLRFVVKGKYAYSTYNTSAAYDLEIIKSEI